MNQFRTDLANLMRRHRPLLFILLVYFSLSLGYNIASPIFEPPDEATHFRYVKYLLDHKKLPVLRDGPNRDEVWGLHQPPLYFFMAAILAYPFDLIAPNDFLVKNPHVNLGFARRPGNKNFYLHTEAEAFPYRGVPLVIRYLRLFSMTCGAITLIIVYRMGLIIFAGQKSLALIAPALITLHPEFVFINNEIANEPLNILLMAAGLWGSMRLIMYGPSTRLAIFLGAVTGLIALAKMTGLALILLVIIAMLMAALRGHSAIKLWGFGILVGSLTVVIGGWWYIRNIFIYGDPWQAAMYRDFYSEVQRAITFSDWYSGILAGEISFWAAFGWFNITVPEWIYTVYKIFVRLGLLGLALFWLKWLWRGFREREIGHKLFISPISPDAPGSPGCPPMLSLFLFVSPLISSLILTRLIATEGGIQGRQLLPMLPALSLLLVLGYRVLLPGRLFQFATLGGGIFMALLTSAMPFFIIAPAYAPPRLLAEKALPVDMTPLQRRYGEQIKLLGYKLETEQLMPGQLNVITLYWQALEPIAKNYTVFVHALGRNMEKVGEYNGYAGLGTFPTGRWPVGPVIEDRYELLIEPAAIAPTLLRLHVGFFEFERLDLPPLTVTDRQGNEVSTQVAQQILLSERDIYRDCTAVDINFADNIRLACYHLFRDAGGAQALSDELILRWQVAERPQHDYTVFIQAWQDGRQVAGFDGPPFGNDFPTSYWQPEFSDLRDVHRIDWQQLPPGDYRLLVGLYNSQTGERLPVFDGQGQPLPDYAVDLGQITIN